MVLRSAARPPGHHMRATPFAAIALFVRTPTRCFPQTSGARFVSPRLLCRRHYAELSRTQTHRSLFRRAATTGPRPREGNSMTVARKLAEFLVGTATAELPPHAMQHAA